MNMNARRLVMGIRGTYLRLCETSSNRSYTGSQETLHVDRTDEMLHIRGEAERDNVRRAEYW